MSEDGDEGWGAVRVMADRAARRTLAPKRLRAVQPHRRDVEVHAYAPAPDVACGDVLTQAVRVYAVAGPSAAWPVASALRPGSGPLPRKLRTLEPGPLRIPTCCVGPTAARRFPLGLTRDDRSRVAVMTNRMALLNKLLEGWARGDSEVIVASLAEDFVFENPNSGRISKSEFKGYFEQLKQQMTTMGYAEDKDFMTFSNVMTHDDGETLVTWLWYEITGTPVRGASLVKVTDAGVRSDWLTFHAPPKLGT